MAALDFPNAPTLNQTFTGPNGVIWAWDGSKWINGTAVGTAYAPIASPVFTGDPQAPQPPVGDHDASIATTAFVAAAVAPAMDNVGRNYIHNPLFNVAQRGVGPFSAVGFTADRWRMYVAGGDTMSVGLYALVDADRASIADEAAITAIANTFTGTSTASSQNTLYQNIEGVRRLSGKSVTLSFWARFTSGTPRLGIAWAQNFGTGGSPSATVQGNIGVATLTGSWTRYTMTVALPSTAGKTVGSNNDDSLGIQFFSSCAPTNPNYAASGNLGVQSGAIWMWGIQLEIGSVATPLEKPDPADDLRKCQRFFSVLSPRGDGYGAGTGNISLPITYPTSMRAAPTITFSAPAYGNCSGISSANVGNAGCVIFVTVTATGAFTWTIGYMSMSADL